MSILQSPHNRSINGSFFYKSEGVHSNHVMNTNEDGGFFPALKHSS